MTVSLFCHPFIPISSIYGDLRLKKRSLSSNKELSLSSDYYKSKKGHIGGHPLLKAFHRRLWPWIDVYGQIGRWPLLKRVSSDGGTSSQLFAPEWPSMRYAYDLPVRSIFRDEFTEENFFRELEYVSKNRGELILPPGRLELRRSIFLPSGVRLIGVPGATEIVFRGVFFGIVICGRRDAPVIGTRVENLRIRLREVPGRETAVAVFSSHSKGLILNNIDVSSPEGVGFAFVDNVIDSKFDNLGVYDGLNDGFLFVRDIKGCTLSNCVAESCLNSGFHFADWPLKEKNDDSEFSFRLEASPSIAFNADDPHPCRINLYNCISRKNRKMGVCTDGGSRLRFIGCIFAENQCEGITLDNGAWGCHLLGCHIMMNGRRGFQSDKELNEDFVVDEDMLDDGTNAVKLPGVSMDNAAFCHVKGCLIENNFGDGVKLVRADYCCTVSGNTIVGNGKGYSKGHPFYGVQAGNDLRQHKNQFDFPSYGNVITENNILGPHISGVRLKAGTMSNKVYNNTISGAVMSPVSGSKFPWNSVYDNSVHKNSNVTGISKRECKKIKREIITGRLKRLKGLVM